MLYQFYDWHRTAMEPRRALAQMANEFYGHPMSPASYLPGSRRLAAAFDLVGRLTQHYGRPEFGIASVRAGGRTCAVREVVELEKPFCRLLHFVRQGAPAQPKVIVFAPLSGHFATLLRDTVNTLLADHDVWITDWIDAKEVPLSAGPFHLDDYVAYAIEFIRLLGPDVHVMAVCQPTVPVLAAVAALASRDGKVTYMNTIVTLDHSMLLKKSTAERDKFETLYAFGETITELKRKYPICFIILIQLNRNVDDPKRNEEGKFGNYVLDSDIFGADALLQHADTLIGLNRPGKNKIRIYGPDKYIIDDDNIIAMHFLKCRNGDTRISFFRAEFQKMKLVEIPPPAKQESRLKT